MNIDGKPHKLSFSDKTKLVFFTVEERDFVYEQLSYRKANIIDNLKEALNSDDSRDIDQNVKALSLLEAVYRKLFD